MKRPSKPVYRPCDIVEIVEPLVVKRVGYAIGLADGIAHIEATYSKDIHELLVKTGIEKPALSDENWYLPEDGDHTNNTFAQIAKVLAFRWVAMQGFGGNVRSIHTELREDLRGRQCRVLSKRNVKTGTRYGPSGGYDSGSGWYDCEPGGLDNCTTHVILECELIGDGTVMGFADPFEIEVCHVRMHVAPWVEAESA